MNLPRPTTVWLALALALLAGPVVRRPSGWAVFGFLAGLAAAWRMGALPPRHGRWLLMAGGLAALSVVLVSPSIALGPMARWFSSRDGLFYWNPILWLGLPGAALPGARGVVGASLIAAAAYAFVSTAAPAAVLEAAVPALLFPSMAAVLEAARDSARRRPMVWLAAGGGLLTVSNLLFMEQYRRHLIPRDDTVSFAEVSRTSGALFRQAFGSPRTWPACWAFAVRHGVAPGRYEAIAGAPWRLEASDAEGIDLRTEAVDPLWIPLRARLAVDVTLEASGRGTVELNVNGRPAAAIPLTPEGGEARVRVAESHWRRGLNALRLVPSPGATPQWTRLTLRRVGGGA